MNIAIDIRCLTNSHRTGVGEYTYELLDSLFCVGRHNQYFLFYNSFKDVSSIVPRWNQENVHYVISRFPNKIFHLLVWLGIIKLDRFVQKKLETVGGLEVKNLVLDYFFSPNLNFTSVSHKTKFILTIHDLSYKYFKDCFSWKRRVWHRAVRPEEQIGRANIVLTPSENTRQDVIREYGVSKEKVFVVRPGLSRVFSVGRPAGRGKENVAKKYGLPDRFILFLGTIEPRKNILGIIDAYKSLQSFSTEYCPLVIAGAKGWKHKRVFEQVEKISGVRYIGYIDEEDKASLYGMSDLFIYPSLYEGFGFPVLEACAIGTPVITSNRSSLPEVVSNAAYLVNPYNTSEIRKGIEFLLGNEKLRGKLIERGKKILNNFDYKKTAQEFLSLIQ